MVAVVELERVRNREGNVRELVKVGMQQIETFLELLGILFELVNGQVYYLEVKKNIIYIGENVSLHCLQLMITMNKNMNNTRANIDATLWLNLILNIVVKTV